MVSLMFIVKVVIIIIVIIVKIMRDQNSQAERNVMNVMMMIIAALAFGFVLFILYVRAKKMSLAKKEFFFYKKNTPKKEKEYLDGNYIFVRTLTGKNIAIEVDLVRDTVANVQAKIQDKEGIPVFQQRLIFRGNQLQEHLRLNDIDGLELGSTIDLVLRLIGC